MTKGGLELGLTNASGCTRNRPRLPPNTSARPGSSVLAKNQKLRTARYPVFVVTNGQKGMPPFGPMMDDEQIAAVVNYVRTSLGNE